MRQAVISGQQLHEHRRPPKLVLAAKTSTKVTAKLMT
jgi:hypothetical protein